MPTFVALWEDAHAEVRGQLCRQKPSLLCGFADGTPSVFLGHIPGPEAQVLPLPSANSEGWLGTSPLWGHKRPTKCRLDVEVKRGQEGLGRQQATDHYTRGSSAGHVT